MRAMLLLFLPVFFSSSIFSQQIDFRRALVARKNHNEFLIPDGKKYGVTFLENGQLKKIKTFYIGANKDSIYFSSRNGKNETTITAGAIQSIRKISSKYRLVMGITAGATLFGTAKLTNAMDAGRAKYGHILIIPMTGLAIYSLCTIPISFVTDLITEKSIKKGWTFSTQRL